MTILRDPIYYITDGNTIILVEDTLFKVHRSNLIKDNSTFNDMFSMDTHKPDGIRGTEGESDENPIRLLGDTAAEFRALMWSLYALPSEVSQKVLRKSVFQFCYLGRIAHKYQFQSLESWTLNALTDFVGADTDDYKKVRKTRRHGFDKCFTHTVKITELAVLCEHSDLLAVVTDQWVCLIRDGECLDLAIDMAEHLGLKKILGFAYYVMMLKGREHWSRLTRAQHIRLLSGYHTITQMCEELPSTPPTMTHDPSCAKPADCARVWSQIWHRAHGDTDVGRASMIYKLQKTDLLGRMAATANILRYAKGVHGLSEVWFRGMHAACIKLAIKAAEEKIKEVRDRLADMFTDVE